MANMFNQARGMEPEDLFYFRVASTMANPVPANTSGYPLMNFQMPTNHERLLIYTIGTDQHMSSTYTWIVDGVVLPVSGTAGVGSIYAPLTFPEPLKVTQSVLLYIENGNGVPYPNSGLNPDDKIPYEGVMIGRWT